MGVETPFNAVNILGNKWDIFEGFKGSFHRIAYKEFKSNFLLLTLDVCYDWLTEKKKDSLALKVRVCLLLKYKIAGLHYV